MSWSINLILNVDFTPVPFLEVVQHGGKEHLCWGQIPVTRCGTLISYFYCVIFFIYKLGMVICPPSCSCFENEIKYVHKAVSTVHGS